MKSPIVKRSVVIEGHKTSVSLEDQFWSGLKEIAHARQMTVSKLISKIEEARHGNLSSAIRARPLNGLRDVCPKAAIPLYTVRNIDSGPGPYR